MKVTTFSRYHGFILGGTALGLVISLWSVFSNAVADETASSTPPVVEEVVDLVLPEEPVAPEIVAPTIEETIDTANSSEETVMADFATTTEPTTTETIASTTPEQVTTADEGSTTPAEGTTSGEAMTTQSEPTLDTLPTEDWYPLTPADCHTEEARARFVNPGECMRMVLR